MDMYYTVKRKRRILRDKQKKKTVKLTTQVPTYRNLNRMNFKQLKESILLNTEYSLNSSKTYDKEACEKTGEREMGE